MPGKGPKKSAATAKKLLKGHSLRVILHPHPGHMEAQVEGFELRHVIMDGDKFWGITSSAVSLAFHGNPEFDLTKPGCYAYCNYADMVLNGSHLSGYTRIINAGSYSKIEFIAVPDFELIWESGAKGSVADVRKAVAKGRRLKIAFHDAEGYWNLHPVCMPLVYVDRDNFRLDTEMDAYPEIVRHTDQIGRLAKDFIREAKEKQEDFASGKITHAWGELRNVPYRSAYYFFWDNNRFVHDPSPSKNDSDGKLITEAYERLLVFAEL